MFADIAPDLWNASLDMFPNPENIQFLQANVLDRSPQAERLEGYSKSVGVISLNRVLHVLSKEQVESMLHACAELLIPGGIVLGSCVGSLEPRPWKENAVGERWLHSSASLSALLESTGFEDARAEPICISRSSSKPPADNQLRIAFSARKLGSRDSCCS